MCWYIYLQNWVILWKGQCWDSYSMEPMGWGFSHGKMMETKCWEQYFSRWCSIIYPMNNINMYNLNGNVNGEHSYENGWWYSKTPLKNMSSSIGMMTFPIYGKKKCSKPPTRVVLNGIFYHENMGIFLWISLINDGWLMIL